MNKKKTLNKSTKVDHVYTWQHKFKPSLNPFKYRRQIERSINMLRHLYNTLKNDRDVQRIINGEQEKEIEALKFKLQESERLYKIDLARTRTEADSQRHQIERLRSRMTKAENQIRRLFTKQNDNKS